jgi:hypothetical protein
MQGSYFMLCQHEDFSYRFSILKTIHVCVQTVPVTIQSCVQIMLTGLLIKARICPCTASCVEESRNRLQFMLQVTFSVVSFLVSGMNKQVSDVS